MPHKRPPPSHILVIGTGVFGLSTLSALLARPLYQNTRFTVIAPSSLHAHTASVDSTRIIRADYSDPLYSALGAACQHLWRQSPWNADYHESGLLLSSKASVSSGEKDYVRACLHTTAQTVDPSALQVLDSRAALSRAMRAGKAARNSGGFGYMNNASGWGDAGSAVDRLRERLATDPRVTWVDGHVDYLLLAPTPRSSSSGAAAKPRVVGAHVPSHGQIHADLTLLAAGAWTPSLVDMRGVASCTAQTMAYVSLSDAEAATLARLPVCIDFARGCFFFPPTPRRTSEAGTPGWEIKVAKHAYGYSNPTAVDTRRVCGAALADAADAYAPSLPAAQGTPIPSRDAQELLAYLDSSLPSLNLRRTLRRRAVDTRLCHYLDTKTGDFIVAPHPDLDEDGLVVLTGDSGHGFKFLPLLGEKVVDVVEALLSLDDHGQRAHEVEQWRQKWAWPARAKDDTVWCEDGSRGGSRGHVLRHALARSVDVRDVKL